MAEKRGRGERFPPGQTQREIVKFILNFKDGVREVEIKSFLYEEFGISDQRSIKNHLEKLFSDGILIKEESRGKSNIWRLYYENKRPVAYYIIGNFLNQAYSAACLEDVLIGEKLSWEMFQTEGVQKFISTNSFWDEFFLFLIGWIKDEGIFGNNVINLNIGDEDFELLQAVLTESLQTSLLLFKSIFYPFLINIPVYENLYMSNALSDVKDEDLLFVTFCLIILFSVFAELIRHRDEINDSVKKILDKLHAKRPDLSPIFLKIFRDFYHPRKEKKYFDRIRKQFSYSIDEIE